MIEKIDKYEEIINTSWPQKSNRPRMDLEQRAKIFLPFSALRGYEESLENQRQLNLEKYEEKYSPQDEFEENFLPRLFP